MLTCTCKLLKIEEFNCNRCSGMANSVDSDQAAPFWSSLIWVFTVFSDLSVPLLRVLRYFLIPV